MNVLFPAQADNRILGSKVPFYAFMLIAIIGSIRSCIHMLAHDAGLSSIAGLDLNISGAKDVVFFCSQWGAEQLIYVLIQWIVIIRYKSLIPVMWLIQFLETFLRMFIAHIKPITFMHTPPGAIEDKIYLPLSLGMAIYALLSAGRDQSTEIVSEDLSKPRRS